MPSSGSLKTIIWGAQWVEQAEKISQVEDEEEGGSAGGSFESLGGTLLVSALHCRAGHLRYFLIFSIKNVDFFYF